MPRAAWALWHGVACTVASAVSCVTPRQIMQTKLVTMLAMAATAFAQTTVKDAMAKHWKTSGEFTIAVANAMPADGYTFRPNPEEMSYGQLMAHIAGVNLNACSNASGLA